MVRLERESGDNAAARSLVDLFAEVRQPWLANGSDWLSGQDLLQLAARYRSPALRGALVLVPVNTAAQALAGAVAVEDAGGVPVLWPARVGMPSYAAALPRVDHNQFAVAGRTGRRWSGSGAVIGVSSGGTSGAGKVVLLEVGRAVRNAAAVADRVSIGRALRVVSLRNPAFSAGLVCDVLGSMLAGDQVAPIPVSSALLGVRAVRRLKPDAVHGAPTIVDEVAHLMTPVRRLVVSGEPLSEPVLHRLRDRFPTAVIMNGYGLSEAGPRVSVGLADSHSDGLSTGLPLPGVTVRRGDDGTLVITTVYGCLAVLDRNGMTPSGPDIGTGDIGRIARDGTVIVGGRAADVVSVRGQQINVAVVAADLRCAVPSAEVSVNTADGVVVIGLSATSDEAAAQDRHTLNNRLRSSWPMLGRVRWHLVVGVPRGPRFSEAGKTQPVARGEDSST